MANDEKKISSETLGRAARATARAARATARAARATARAVDVAYAADDAAWATARAARAARATVDVADDVSADATNIAASAAADAMRNRIISFIMSIKSQNHKNNQTVKEKMNKIISTENLCSKQTWDKNDIVNILINLKDKHEIDILEVLPNGKIKLYLFNGLEGTMDEIVNLLSTHYAYAFRNWFCGEEN